MLLSSFVGSIMTMTADIYIQQNSQDPNTGSLTREWVYSKTVPCKVEAIKSSGSSTRGDSKSFSKTPTGTEYSEKLQLRIKTLELLSKRWRINKIRTSDGQQVFVELDRFGKPDSIFEVFSSHTVLDPFSKISYSEAVLQRVPEQDNDQTNN